MRHGTKTETAARRRKSGDRPISIHGLVARDHDHLKANSAETLGEEGFKTFRNQSTDPPFGPTSTEVLSIASFVGPSVRVHDSLPPRSSEPLSE